MPQNQPPRLTFHQTSTRLWIHQTGIRAVARLTGLPPMRVSRFANATGSNDTLTLYTLLAHCPRAYLHAPPPRTRVR